MNHLFRVMLDIDRWEPDRGRVTVEVEAPDHLAARLAAQDQLRPTHPCAVGVHVERLDGVRVER